MGQTRWEHSKHKTKCHTNTEPHTGEETHHKEQKQWGTHPYMETLLSLFLLLIITTTPFLSSSHFSTSISSLWCCSVDNPLRTRHATAHFMYHCSLFHSFKCLFLSSSLVKSSVWPIFFFPCWKVLQFHTIPFWFLLSETSGLGGMDGVLGVLKSPKKGWRDEGRHKEKTGKHSCTRKASWHHWRRGARTKQSTENRGKAWHFSLSLAFHAYNTSLS